MERERDIFHVHAVIETPKHSRHKYSLNNDYGIIAFHEVMPAEMEWHGDARRAICRSRVDQRGLVDAKAAMKIVRRSHKAYKKQR